MRDRERRKEETVSELVFSVAGFVVVCVFGFSDGQAWIWDSNGWRISWLISVSMEEDEMTVGSVRLKETFFLTRRGRGLSGLLGSSCDLEDEEQMEDDGECMGVETFFEKMESVTELVEDRKLAVDVSEEEDVKR